MPYLMGIDLGTSSLKTMIVDEAGKAMAIASRDYMIESPVAGFAEQTPQVWWDACVATCRQAIAQSGVDVSLIKGVGFSGQMHGMVPLDENYEVVRPAILHCDARSCEQVQMICETLGAQRIRELTGNPIYTGFLLTSLLWVRDNEPENYRRIRHVCLPKDYIKYKLCGLLSSDYSDASATLAFDLENNCWSKQLLDIFSLPADIFPACFDAFAPVGCVTEAAALETGLCEGTTVVAGGADQVMQGLGNGAIGFDTATVNIGSSGQVSFQSAMPLVNPALCTNTFAGYQKGRWIVMGAIMHAGLALKWFKNLLDIKSYAQLDALAASVRPGSGGVLFLPYLNGERTPHINPALSASFFGCTMQTGKAEMARAVMEGVAFALMQCMEVCGDIGLSASEVIASGGGARSELWLQIQSDIYGLPLKVAESAEQACLGAAIVAGVGCGVYEDVAQGCAAAVRYQDKVILPDMKNHAIYMEYYRLFKDSYQAGRDIFTRATRLGRES
ncbi:MAG: xylulokinase [Clostridia bacterium]|nr:xylulokinase [Clostridia bacterium]